MKKLLKELFYVPKYGKVREKVMIVQVAMSVSIIVMCLAAMSLSAYAFFSYNVTSASNTIQAANFEATVQIADENGEPVAVTPGGDNTHTAELKANTEYSITLQATDRSTAKTGFVIITAENCDSKYHTEQLGKDSNGNAETVTFWLKPNATTTVTFLSRWGTSSYYANYIQTGENSELYILTGEHVTLSVNPVKFNAPQSSNTNKTIPTGTTPPAQTVPSEPAGTSAPTPGTEQSSTTEPSVAPTGLSVATDATEATVPQSSETTAPSAAPEPTETQPPASTETEAAETETIEPSVTQPTIENTVAPAATATEASE